ncbi:MAG TPA: TolC family protein [Kofleriaceae bacterium]
MKRAALLALAGCSAVHPVDAHAPKAPAAFVTSFDVADKPPAPPPPAISRVANGEVWWSAFRDPTLDNAIQEAFRDNYFIRDTRGLIYENQLDPNTPQGWWYPLQVGILNPAGFQHLRAVVDPSPRPYVFNQANIDIAATYQVDLWGKLDAQRRAGMNFAEQQRQLTEGHVQDLAVQIAQTWFDILESRALRQLTLDQVKYNQDLYDLLKSRFEQHLTPHLVVLQQEQLLVNLQSQLPLINSRLALENSALHQLLGRTPSPADDIVPLDRRLPDLPPPPGIGTPDELDKNTPEMRLAKLRVEEVQHRINANLASWLPQVQLTGSVGVAQLDVSTPEYAKQPIQREDILGVTLTWVMFDGRRITEARQLPMQLRRREIQYELALQTAVGRVQDAVIREDNQATSLKSLREQVELGSKVLEEARHLFDQGQSDYLPVIQALTALTDLQRAALQSQRSLLNCRVELYRSLGGTWSYDVTLPREK